MNKLVFKKYEFNNKFSLLELLAFKWKHLKTRELKNKFEWRYEQNPYNKNNPFIYVALNGEQVVGFRAFVIQHFMLRNVLYKVFNPADAIVHPDFRRMGIFSKLNEAFLTDLQHETNAIVLNTSSNNLSTPGYLKQGWQSINYCNRYGFKINLLLTFKNLFGISRKHNNQFEEIIRKYKDNKLIFTTQLRINDIVTLNRKNRNINVITHYRDQSFYNWRYAYPNQNNYFAYYYEEEKLIGYIIFSKRSEFQFMIEEYIAPTRNIFKRLMCFSSRYFRISIIRSHVFSQNEKQKFKSIGFIFEPLKLMTTIGKIRLPFLVRPISLYPTDNNFLIDNHIDIRDSANWDFAQSAIH